MRYAVIDLGTNTFHLLIVELQPDGSWHELAHERPFVKLASDGIKTIGTAAFQRGLQAVQYYKRTMELFEVDAYRAVGTAALRTASNGREFVEKVQALTGIAVEVIDGDSEARYIYQGVKQACPISSDYHLIMDIGGGSVEFIIANDKGWVWGQSFPIGLAVLKKNFPHQDPMTLSGKQLLQHFLIEILQPLWDILKIYPAYQLIGASGTFDVLEKMLVPQKPHPLHSFISIPDFYKAYHQILPKTLHERFAMREIGADRAEMITYALILIEIVLQKAHIQQIMVSAYALKEGVLADMATIANH